MSRLTVLEAPAPTPPRPAEGPTPPLALTETGSTGARDDRRVALRNHRGQLSWVRLTRLPRPGAGRTCVSSPLGQALLDIRVGDEVFPAGYRYPVTVIDVRSDDACEMPPPAADARHSETTVTLRRGDDVAWVRIGDYTTGAGSTRLPADSDTARELLAATVGDCVLFLNSSWTVAASTRVVPGRT